MLPLFQVSFFRSHMKAHSAFQRQVSAENSSTSRSWYTVLDWHHFCEQKCLNLGKFYLILFLVN